MRTLVPLRLREESGRSRLSRIDVLVIDDWVMAPLSEPERRDFWEICEDRYQVRSTILTSQLPVSRWHEQVGDPTLADGILDRLVHNAYRIEMRGDSMRKSRLREGVVLHGAGPCPAQRGVEIARLLFVVDKIPKHERDRVRRDLLEYCHRDALAMVRLVETLEGLARVAP